jgi:hypothetical protein
MSLRLQPVQVATGSDDAESQLVFDDGFLVAVLVLLSDQHEDDAGQWFLETGYGPIDPVCPPPFADLDEAQAWIADPAVVSPLMWHREGQTDEKKGWHACHPASIYEDDIEAVALRSTRPPLDAA